jgi:hypothetical protein
MTARSKQCPPSATSGRRPNAVRRSGLPGRLLAEARLSRIEQAVFMAVVPLLSVPALLATGMAMWVLAPTLALSAAVSWLCLARHTVVGRGWVADRRLVRYRVTHAVHLRAVEMVANGHGGLLKVYPATGRPHRLRAVEVSATGLRAALAALVDGSRATVSPCPPPLQRRAEQPAGAARRARDISAGEEPGRVPLGDVADADLAHEAPRRR